MVNEITDSLILKELKERLSKLLSEERKAIKEKEIRDISIQKTKIAIEAFTDASEIEIVKEGFNRELNNNNDEFEYPKNKTWQEKIKAFLKYKNKVVTISEIVEGMLPHEPEYTSEKIHAAISNMVSTMLKKELLKVHKPKTKMKGYYYGNPLWFEGEELKQEYEPNMEQKLIW